MRIQNGDVVFNSAGSPGVVKGRKEGVLTVDARQGAFDDTRRYGIINGLNPADRVAFREIISSLEQVEGAPNRAEQLSQQIQKLEQDPRNFQLLKYLRAEQAHLMHTTGEKAASYTIQEHKL